MNSDAPRVAGGFATTRWSIVLAAGANDTQAGKALGELCRLYWYPLYAFVRRQGQDAHAAQDLTQEFFARLIEKEWLGEVARERGRFRSWLLASMRHFLANEWNKERTQKRGGGALVVSLDETDAEGRYLHEPAAVTDAAQLFDRRWAMTLLDGVLARLQGEMQAAGKAAQFDALKAALLGGAPDYRALAAGLRMSEGAARVAVHRLRERYRELLRAAVAETVESPAEIEGELQYLFAALSV
ncbi:MAG TPA: sigma factor [Chthoniobacteraceae bacterium]|jgi:RNA polymerase sigma-70 factor (ECF subfamily)|nr:sigma factor [Chthoniobacteraceae bacterium]